MLKFKTSYITISQRTSTGIYILAEKTKVRTMSNFGLVREVHKLLSLFSHIGKEELEYFIEEEVFN